MEQLFATTGLAEGYATARPAVHPLVIEKLASYLKETPIRVALDVGCGAGLSTRPLERIAKVVVGMEPAASMLHSTSVIAPRSSFLAASAEHMPFRDASIDLIAAAGALNYVNLEAFLPEAQRILSNSGVLAVYDFSPGRRSPDSPGLQLWFEEFMRRYPKAKDSARSLDPETIAKEGGQFVPMRSEYFEIPLTLDAEFYERYMMTETNVAYAIRQGASEDEIRQWCHDSLREVFSNQPRTVLFEGYLATFTPRR